MGNPAAVKFGPGTLYIAPIGTTEPTGLTSTWVAGFVQLGYTDAGHEFSQEQSFEDIEVAEEVYPITHALTKIAAMVNFSLAEITATNLKRALNGGTVSAPAGGFVTFDPPAPNAVVRMMLGWDSDDAQERWLFRKCIQVGGVTIPRKKGPDKALVPCQFALEKPTGVQPFKAFFADTLA